MNIDFLISLTLGLIMFGIGFSLKREDFQRIFQKPKSLGIGLLLQIIILPLIALLVVSFTDLSPEWKMGVFIVSICPGGTTSNFISYLLKTDVALSISLTIINSFIILLTIPLLVHFGLNHFGLGGNDYDLNILETVQKVFLIIILPVVVGVFLHEKFAKYSKQIQQPLKYINILLLAAVFGIKFFASEEDGGSGISRDIIFILLPACLAVHLIPMIGSYLISRGLRLTNLQSVTIGIEVGLQNTGLALLVTTTIIGNEVMAQPALVFAIFSFFTTLAFGYFMKKRTRPI